MTTTLELSGLPQHVQIKLMELRAKAIHTGDNTELTSMVRRVASLYPEAIR